MKWHKLSEKKPRLGKLFILIHQAKLLIGIIDKDDDGYKYYNINNKYFNEYYILEMLNFGNPVFEYWMYFPMQGFPKDGLSLNVCDGDLVISREEVLETEIMHTKGDEWLKRARGIGCVTEKEDYEQYP